MPTAVQDELMDDLFSAIEAGDPEAIERVYSPDVEVWNNVTGRPLGKDDSVELLRYFIRAVPDRRYEVIERRRWDGGALQRHVLHGTVRGEPLRIDVCIVFEFSGGAITRIHEYLDSAAVAALIPS